MSSDNVVITKYEAARRLVNAAIRMYFRNDDELATHTVVGAALNLVIDLNQKRGQGVQGKLFEVGIKAILQDYAHGRMPIELRDSDFVKIILSVLPAEIVDLLNSGTVPDLEFEPTKLPELVWFDKRKTVNFLKHADRDTTASLTASDIDNYDLLKWVIAAYSMLGLPPSTETLMFSSYIFSVEEEFEYKANDGSMMKLARRLREIPRSERGTYCLRLIAE